MQQRDDKRERGGWPVRFKHKPGQIRPEITTIMCIRRSSACKSRESSRVLNSRKCVWTHRHICRITAAAFRRKRMELLHPQRRPLQFGGRATSVKQLRRNLASRRKWSLRSSPNRHEISSVRVRPMTSLQDLNYLSLIYSIPYFGRVGEPRTLTACHSVMVKFPPPALCIYCLQLWLSRTTFFSRTCPKPHWR